MRPPSRSRRTHTAAVVALSLILPTPSASFVIGPTTAPLRLPHRSCSSCSSAVLSPPGNFSPRFGSHLHSWQNTGGDDSDDLRDDIQTLKTAAGSIARKVGSKLKNTFQEGGNKLKKLISRPEEKNEVAEPEPLPQSRLQPRRRDYDGVWGGGRGLSELFLGIPDFTPIDFALGPRLMRDTLFGSDSLLSVTISKQSRQVDGVLENAMHLLDTDATATSLLGKPLTAGRTISQRSSVTTINGKTKSSIQATFTVQGPVGAGVASVSSSDGKIESLDLETDGWRHEVNVKGRRGEAGSRGQVGKQDILEAEIVEKM